MGTWEITQPSVGRIWMMQNHQSTHFLDFNLISIREYRSTGSGLLCVCLHSMDTFLFDGLYEKKFLSFSHVYRNKDIRTPSKMQNNVSLTWKSNFVSRAKVSNLPKLY